MENKVLRKPTRSRSFLPDNAWEEAGKTKNLFRQPMGLSAVNINEAEEEYLLCVAAPGLRREDFFVSVDKKIITIAAVGKEGELPKDSNGQDLSEQVRTFRLPDNADPLLNSATYTNGKLEIHIPKGENTEEKPLLIHVY